MIITFEIPSAFKDGAETNSIAGIRPCSTHVVDELIIFGVAADVQGEIGWMVHVIRNRIFMEEEDQP